MATSGLDFSNSLVCQTCIARNITNHNKHLFYLHSKAKVCNNFWMLQFMRVEASRTTTTTSKLLLITDSSPTIASLYASSVDFHVVDQSDFAEPSCNANHKRPADVFHWYQTFLFNYLHSKINKQLVPLVHTNLELR